MAFLDFSALITKIAAAAKTEGIELSQDEIDKAVKKLAQPRRTSSTSTVSRRTSRRRDASAPRRSARR